LPSRRARIALRASLFAVRGRAAFVPPQPQQQQVTVRPEPH